jgi:hypothetical protein
MFITFLPPSSRPVGCRSSETQSYPIVMNNKCPTHSLLSNECPTGDGFFESKIPERESDTILSNKKAKAVPLHATKALGWRGSIAPTHSRPRHWVGASGQCHALAVL